jgi:hypothetical protein
MVEEVGNWHRGEETSTRVLGFNEGEPPGGEN